MLKLTKPTQSVLHLPSLASSSGFPELNIAIVVPSSLLPDNLAHTSKAACAVLPFLMLEGALLDNQAGNILICVFPAMSTVSGMWEALRKYLPEN